MKTIKLFSMKSPGLAVLLFLVFPALSQAAYPVSFVDSCGTRITLQEKPRRVVSLSPSVTDIICRLGAGDCLAGITLHDRVPGSDEKEIVGGFLAPSPVRVRTVRPDVVFASTMNRETIARQPGEDCRTIVLEPRSLEELFRNIRLLGTIFDREAAAEEAVGEIQRQLWLISSKVEKIPREKRKRVVRLMEVDGGRVMTAGDDSLQDEFIRAAGGIPPRLGKTGDAVEMSLEEWRRFDPQFVYACGGNREAVMEFLSRPGWKEVEAVRRGRIYCFPCNLACRASTHSGEFVSWLASSIYDEEFASERNRVLPEKQIRAKPLDIPLDYVRSAKVVETTIYDFPNRTLILDFRGPMRVTSTLEGERSGIKTVGNHYFPPPCWSIGDRCGLKGWKDHALKAIRKSSSNSCFLFTGADMENLSVQSAHYGDMTVWALVTAGVESNAMRMSADAGLFYEPGTINVILLTNMRLSPRARARAIITATEAKTAAMQDLDVRSTVSPGGNQATGTGTDEVLVVEGRGTRVDNAGGHSKLGELIAKSVYAGVRDAVLRQNGISSGRSAFRRLEERRIDLYGLLRESGALEDEESLRRHLARLEDLLVEPRYASFLEAALALSDAHERGLAPGLELFEAWCRSVAEEIAGKKPDAWIDRVKSQTVPLVVRMALNAMLNGVAQPQQR